MKFGVGSYTPETGWKLASEPAEAADFEANKLQFVRSHAGPALRVMLDAHMDNSPEVTWDLETALAVAKAVEPYDLFFFEEPLPYTDPWGYAEIARSTRVPIAGGECLTAEYELRDFPAWDAPDR